MKIEITITAKEGAYGWDKEKVDKVIELDVTPNKHYAIGGVVETLLIEAVKERQDKLDQEEKAEQAN